MQSAAWSTHGDSLHRERRCQGEQGHSHQRVGFLLGHRDDMGLWDQVPGSPIWSSDWKGVFKIHGTVHGNVGSFYFVSQC